MKAEKSYARTIVSIRREAKKVTLITLDTQNNVCKYLVETHRTLLIPNLTPLFCSTTVRHRLVWEESENRLSIVLIASQYH